MKQYNRYTRTTGSKTMILVDCPGELYPVFGTQKFTDKWFLSVSEGKGTHGIQAEYVNGQYKPLGWTLVNRELSVYKKEDVYAYSVSGSITLDTKDGRIDYKNETGGYVLSNDPEFTDVWYNSIEEFNENYELVQELVIN